MAATNRRRTRRSRSFRHRSACGDRIDCEMPLAHTACGRDSRSSASSAQLVQPFRRARDDELRTRATSAQHVPPRPRATRAGRRPEAVSSANSFTKQSCAPPKRKCPFGLRRFDNVRRGTVPAHKRCRDNKRYEGQSLVTRVDAQPAVISAAPARAAATPSRCVDETRSCSTTAASTTVTMGYSAASTETTLR